EESLLGYVRGQLLTEPTLARLLAEANAQLRIEVSRAPRDVAPLRSEIDELAKRRARLITALELDTGYASPGLSVATGGGPGGAEARGDKHGLLAVTDRIRELGNQIGALQAQVISLERANRAAPV